jgi:hypothetical protein
MAILSKDDPPIVGAFPECHNRFFISQGHEIMLTLETSFTFLDLVKDFNLDRKKEKLIDYYGDVLLKQIMRGSVHRNEDSEKHAPLLTDLSN